MWIDINRSSSCQAQAENGKESEQHGLVLCQKSYLQMKHREDHHTTKVTSYQIIQISSIFGSSSAMEDSGSMKSYHQLCVSRVHFCHLCLLSLNQFVAPFKTRYPPGPVVASQPKYRPHAATLGQISTSRYHLARGLHPLLIGTTAQPQRNIMTWKMNISWRWFSLQ